MRFDDVLNDLCLRVSKSICRCIVSFFETRETRVCQDSIEGWQRHLVVSPYSSMTLLLLLYHTLQIASFLSFTNKPAVIRRSLLRKTLTQLLCTSFVKITKQISTTKTFPIVETVQSVDKRCQNPQEVHDESDFSSAR